MPPSTALKRLIAVWPLLLGIGVLTTSNGLQGMLLSLRAQLEGFPVEITGIIMAMYYAGFLIGCRYIPPLISSVGHIRVFAALASMASTTVLLHGVFINPWAWIPIRLMTGFCFSGLFIIAESWLNKIANKSQRGTIFSAYVSIVYGGLFTGQFLVNLAPLDSMYLFILISVMISFALAPITLTNTRTPGYQKPANISFKELMKISPLALSGVFTAGLCNGTMLSLGPVYADSIGIEKSSIAIFMGIYILGNTTLPLIIGPISDRVDRRGIITFAGIMAIGCTAFLTYYEYSYVLIYALGGMLTSLYSVSITHMNDQIKKAQIVSASRALILLNSAGSMIGPIVAGILLAHWGAFSFFSTMCLYLTTLLAITIYRAVVGDEIERKHTFAHIPSMTAPAIMRLKTKQAPKPSTKNKEKSE